MLCMILCGHQLGVSASYIRGHQEEFSEAFLLTDSDFILKVFWVKCQKNCWEKACLTTLLKLLALHIDGI